jgi:hypothetical protein
LSGFQVQECFEQFGPVEEVLKPDDQIAYVIFRWVRDAMDAKERVDLSKIV